MPQLTPAIAKYVSISEHLRQQIASGKLARGTRLPSQAKLAEEYGVSLLTARQALGKLETEGLIEQHHGRGTFVAHPKAATPDRCPTAANSIGLLFVDNGATASRTSAYCMGLIRELSDTLSQRQYDLKVATVDDSSLMRRQPHLMLDPVRVRAVVIDGAVSQIHVDFVKNVGLDVLVAGNHPIGGDVPQVRYDVRGAAHQLGAQMMSLAHGPLILWTEPFRFHYTTEILLGYQQAAFEMKQPPIVFSAPPTAVETWDQALRSIAAQHGEKFCLMSMFKNTPRLLQRCTDPPLDVLRVPTCVIGGAAAVDDPAMLPWIINCEMRPGPVARIIAQQIVDALEHGRRLEGTILKPVVGRVDTQADAPFGRRIRCEWKM